MTAHLLRRILACVGVLILIAHEEKTAVSQYNPAATTTVQFESLPESPTDQLVTGYDEPWRTYVENAEPSVSPMHVKSWCAFGVCSQTFSLFDNQRRTLTGLVDKYVVFDLIGAENDICIHVVPDENCRGMADPELLGIDGSVIQRSRDRQHRIVECELTPAESFYDRSYYLPIRHGSRSWWPEDHVYRSGPLEGRRVNLNGVFCADRGHGARPEIHPFDAIWFKSHDPYPWRPTEWVLGVFQDNSNRFDDNWSRPPRAVTFYFPFSVRMPMRGDHELITAEELEAWQDLQRPRIYRFRIEGERGLGGVTFGDGQPLAQNVNTSSVFGDEPGVSPTVIVQTEDDLRATLILDQGQRDELQQVAFVNLNRSPSGSAVDRVYGFVRVRVAVGANGYYYAQLRMPRQDDEPEDAPDGPPQFQLPDAWAQFIDRETVAEPWDHYRADLEYFQSGAAEFQVPDSLQLRLGSSTVAVSVTPAEPIRAVSVFRSKDRFSVGETLSLKSQKEQPYRVRSTTKSERQPAFWFVAGAAQKSLAKTESGAAQRTRWRIPLDIYVSPNEMSARNYPRGFPCRIVLSEKRKADDRRALRSKVRATTRVARGSAYASGAIMIREPKSPEISVRATEIMQPRLRVQGNRKSLELGVVARATPKNIFGKVTQFRWQRAEPRVVDGAPKLHRPTLIPETGNELRFAMPVGDREAVLEVQTKDTDGVNATGRMSVPGTTLFGWVTQLQDPEELQAIPQFTNRLEQQVNTSSLRQLLRPMTKSTTLRALGDQQVRVNTSSLVVLRGGGYYCIYRDGEVFGEEIGPIARRLNQIVYGSGTSQSALREQLFGSGNPIHVNWKIDVRDLAGRPVEFQRSQYSAALDGDTAILTVPMSQPCVIDAQVEIRDDFGQRRTCKVRGYNFRIQQVSQVISRATGLDTNRLRTVVAAKPPASSTDAKLAVTLGRQLSAMDKQEVTPEQFRYALALTSEFRKQSDSSSRARLFRGRD